MYRFFVVRDASIARLTSMTSTIAMGVSADDQVIAASGGQPMSITGYSSPRRAMMESMTGPICDTKKLNTTKMPANPAAMRIAARKASVCFMRAIPARTSMNTGSITYALNEKNAAKAPPRVFIIEEKSVSIRQVYGMPAGQSRNHCIQAGGRCGGGRPPPLGG